MADQAEFKEVARLQTSDSIEVVLSEVHKEGQLTGYSLNKYVTSERFTGFARGIFIPEDLEIEFLKLFSKEDLETAAALKD